MPIERVEGTTSFLGGSLCHVRRVALAPIQGKLPVNPAATLEKRRGKEGRDRGEKSVLHHAVFYKNSFDQ